MLFLVRHVAVHAECSCGICLHPVRRPTLQAIPLLMLQYGLLAALCGPLGFYKYIAFPVHTSKPMRAHLVNLKHRIVHIDVGPGRLQCTVIASILWCESQCVVA